VLVEVVVDVVVDLLDDADDDSSFLPQPATTSPSATVTAVIRRIVRVRTGSIAVHSLSAAPDWLAKVQRKRATTSDLGN